MMLQGRPFTMDARVRLYFLVLTFALVVENLFVNVQCAPYRKLQKTQRLCSKSLSQALHMACLGRGYNEPSGEDSYHGSSGPGLVEECCYNPCSLEQLEAYCKPVSEERPDRAYNALDAPFTIVNLPYSSVKEMVAQDRPGATPNHDRLKKRKDRRRDGHPGKKHEGGAREKGEKGRRKWCRCRRRRHKRRRSGKVLQEMAIPSVPAFQVGTTSPEPIDSIVLFPSKSYAGFK